MGGFYVNYTVKGVKPRDIVSALRGRSAWVATSDGYVLIYDAESDSQDFESVGGLGAKISRSLEAPVLVVLNHDDDFLWYELFTRGKLTDKYNSDPEYFETGEGSTPIGGNAAALCAAFDSANLRQVERVLRQPSDPGGPYVLAQERHRDLAAALGIPDATVGFGFEHIESGERPKGLAESALIRVGPGRV